MIRVLRVSDPPTEPLGLAYWAGVPLLTRVYVMRSRQRMGVFSGSSKEGTPAPALAVTLCHNFGGFEGRMYNSRETQDPTPPSWWDAKRATEKLSRVFVDPAEAKNVSDTTHKSRYAVVNQS